jgi:phosphoribosylformimino-5-aminoimidazole carboxamide ribotide isomerase
MSAVDCGAVALELEITRLIVLDVAAVGIGEGVPTLDVCRAVRSMAPHAMVVSGGGVRGPDDLAALEDAGCDAALVASALHDGAI